MKINGKEIEMEERICVGGCGVKFKVMKGSNTVYAKSRCQVECKHRINHNKEKLNYPDQFDFYFKCPQAN